MLVELVVENYAVVEHARVRFHRGLNLLTGETGSGKSIVVDALGLLYGGRASADVIRSGAARARVTGIFEAPRSAAMRKLLEDSGIEAEDGELLVEREILPNGKSRAFLGSRPVTVALLRELAPLLGDIHGQHDQQELFSAESQLDMVDEFAAAGSRVEAVGRIFERWQVCSRELEELDRGEQEKLRLADLWSFQKREIEEAQLGPGEDAKIEAERRVLMNVARIEESVRGAYTFLYDSGEAAFGQIRQARKRLEDASRMDASLQETADLLKPAEIAIDEASRTLQHYLGSLEADPARLEHIESRLALIEKLKRKYGGSVEEILAFLDGVSERLAAVESAGERRTQLAAEREKLAEEYRREAGLLSEARRKAAAQLEAAVRKELESLAMGGTEFKVAFAEAEWSARGWDRVRFLLSANKGEEARPLDRVASGGELSRLALALKTCVAAQGEGKRGADGKVMRTLVFDEVDTGVGGRTAESVGRRLKKLSVLHQVLCVTHAPQIAAFADHHYAVAKSVSGGRTVAAVEELSAEARRREIGRMLSGEQTTKEALEQAEQLIKAGSR